MKIRYYTIAVLLFCFSFIAHSMDNGLNSSLKPRPQFLERAYQIAQDHHLLFTNNDFENRIFTTLVMNRDFTSSKLKTSRATVFLQREQGSDIVEIKVCGLKQPEKCSTEQASIKKLNQGAYFLKSLKDSFLQSTKTIRMECESSSQTHRVEWIYTLGATHMFFSFDNNTIANLPVSGGGVSHDQDVNLPDGSTYVTVVADIKHGPFMGFMTIFEKEGEKLLNKQPFEAKYLRANVSGNYDINYDLNCNVL